MLKIIIFFIDKNHNPGSWIVQSKRHQHCISVLQKRGSIVTGYEQLI